MYFSGGSMTVSSWITCFSLVIDLCLFIGILLSHSVVRVKQSNTVVLVFRTIVAMVFRTDSRKL